MYSLRAILKVKTVLEKTHWKAQGWNQNPSFVILRTVVSPGCYDPNAAPKANEKEKHTCTVVCHILLSFIDIVGFLYVQILFMLVGHFLRVMLNKTMKDYIRNISYTHFLVKSECNRKICGCCLLFYKHCNAESKLLENNPRNSLYHNLG